MPRARVLAVVAQARNRQLLVEFLEKAGFRAQAAGSIEDLDERLEAAPPPALVLIDLAGLDGRIWERCERLREARVPFVVISRRITDQLRETAAGAGASSILAKPLALKELLALCRALTEAP